MRTTKKQREALARAAESPFVSDADRTQLRDLQIRLEPAPKPPRIPGVSPGELELALLRSCTKAVAMAGANWGRLGVDAQRLDITVAEVDLVGRWVDAQHWLSPPVILETVIRNWPSWSLRARSEEKSPPRAQTPLGDPT